MTPFPIFLAFKYLKPKRNFTSIITIITVLGVAIGVAVLMIVLAVMTGFSDTWKEKILSVKPHITVSPRYTETIEDYYSIVETIKTHPSVIGCSPTIISPVMLKYNDDIEPVIATVIGIEPDGNSLFSQLKDHIDFGTFDISYDNAIIGIDLSYRLNVANNNKVLCYSPISLKSTNELYFPEEINIAGVYNIGMYEVDDGIIITSLGMARDIVGIEKGCYTIQIQIENPEKAFEVAQDLSKILYGVKLTTWQEADKVLFEALRTEKTMMFILLFFIAVVAAFCVTNTLIVITIQKTPEIGLLKALGFSNHSIMSTFVISGQIQCVIGISLGLLIGKTILNNLQNLVLLLAKHGIEVFPKSIYSFSEIPYRIVSSDIIYIVSAVFILCSIAGIIPAWRAAKLNPIKAINQE